MNQTGKIAFAAIISVYVILWGSIIWIGMPKETWTPKKEKHDERQRIEKIRGWQYAYLTLVVYLLLYMLVEKMLGIVWCETTFGILLGLAFSFSVFLTYCVFQDAYFGIGADKSHALITANTSVVILLMLGIGKIEDGLIIENGLITAHATPLVFAGVFLLFDISLIIKRHLDKKKAEQKI